MSAFLRPDAKTRATQAVRAFEARTSAELVVILRRESARYRGVSVFLGAVGAMLALLAVLFLPRDFAVGTIPLDVVFGFAVGALVGSVPQVKRALLLPRVKDAVLTASAKVAFFDHGVSRTSGRTGVLVYASVLERDVRVLCDFGVGDVCKKHLESAATSLRAALRKGDVEAFAKELESCGAAFEPHMPRAADDVNELPDEVG